jgi:hypothetical protein
LATASEPLAEKKGEILLIYGSCLKSVGRH